MRRRRVAPLILDHDEVIVEPNPAPSLPQVAKGCSKVNLGIESLLGKALAPPIKIQDAPLQNQRILSMREETTVSRSQLGTNDLYFLSDKTAGYGRRTRARGMDPTSGLFVGTESNYFPKRENCCSPSISLCLFPVETTDWS